MAGVNIDANATYRVELNKAIQVGRTVVPPGPRVLLLGVILQSVLAEDPNAVKSYKAA